MLDAAIVRSLSFSCPTVYPASLGRDAPDLFPRFCHQAVYIAFAQRNAIAKLLVQLGEPFGQSPEQLHQFLVTLGLDMLADFFVRRLECLSSRGFRMPMPVDIILLLVFIISGIHVEIVLFILTFVSGLVGKQLPTLIALVRHGSIFVRAQSFDVLGNDRHSVFAAAGANWTCAARIDRRCLFCG